MNFIYTVFGWPLGWIMYVCYLIVKNYGLALILFTLITKALQLPLAIKQQKSMMKTAIFKPQMDTLQRKYKNNREKLNEEMMKLYEKEHYNPMSGCLPTLISFPILFGMIDVIYKPITHIIRPGSGIIKSYRDSHWPWDEYRKYHGLPNFGYQFHSGRPGSLE